MAERDRSFRRDDERGGSRYGEGRASAFEGGYEGSRGGGRGESGRDEHWREDRWSERERYGSGGGSYTGPSGPGWGSDMAYGPSAYGRDTARERASGYQGGRDDDSGGSWSGSRGDEGWPRTGSSGRSGESQRSYGGLGETSGSGYRGGRFGDMGYGAGAHTFWGGERGGGWSEERRNRGPKGWQRSDERVHEDVCERLMGESGVDPSDVTVQVSAGVVTLTGTVPERRMKYRIEDLADRVPGVNEVENRIRVNRGMSGGLRPGSSRGSLLGRLFGFSSGSRISDIMTRDPQVVSPDERLKRVAQLMKEHDVGAIPVCNGRELVGMVTDRDLAIRAIAEGKPLDGTKAADVMTTRVHWCYEDEDIDDVLDKMGNLQIRRIPVVDRAKQLVGIVALGDFAQRESGDVEEALQEISQSG